MIFLEILLGLYLVVSLLALGFYWYDKRQSQAGNSRIPEKTLHLLEALGGWPGALLAQQWLRHKTQKQPFQNIFRLIVLGHVVSWGVGIFLYVKYFL
jgi:uncharacterized membrane protein YsdA (DUF1294 family)